MLVAKNLTKEYQSGAHALAVLKDVSFEIPQGALVASSTFGSGKTTLLRPPRGARHAKPRPVLYDAVDITRLDEDARARLRGERVGFISRASSSFRRSRRSRMCRCRSNCGRGECGRPGERPPQPRRARRPTRPLSDAAVRRGTAAVAIARAFVNAPGSSSPTSRLETSTARRAQRSSQLIEELNKSSGSTVVIVTHDASLAARTNRIIR